ncbi:glycosyltransferase [Zhihengliuella flava]|uniref:Glycosyltransferase involved in cell wall biosynthesis n=1 Tax=Zhihengliuella flava TaxID=1285193 RepID=A0A931D7I8_9MICC|nr:hypothetical protein [Zhihengliuella flava]MBG6083517.1 glycosyltransferase involved in cell wall biosynthesis [Zhihengliuella flava]
MKLQYHGFQTAAGSPVREAATAIRHQEAAGRAKPLLVGYTPVARVNPFQSLLYSQLRQAGIAVAPITDPWAFDELLRLAHQTSGVVVHIHWPSFVLRGVSSSVEAEQRVDEFEAKVRAFTASGGRLLWTVHNLVTHDAVYVDAELRLQQLIADSAWRIHVMHESTASLTQDFVRLEDAKTFVIPHPAYLGAYEDYITRAEARETLQIDPDEVVYTIFGAIMAYKGIEDFLEGFDAVASSGRPRRLIVAGAGDGSEKTERLLDRLRAHPRVLLDDRKVPADRVQFLLRAADIMVAPHARALNSGAALLGPTFERPLLARRVGVLPHLLEQSFTEFFDGPQNAAEAIIAADRLVGEEARSAAADFAVRHHASRISSDFAQYLLTEAAVPAGLDVHENA